MLIQFLRNNKHVFAFSMDDSIGVDLSVAEHKRKIDVTHRPVNQKLRSFSPQKLEIMCKEVKLVKARQIEGIRFPKWLANVVIVPKIGGKWRMCIDFWDLNKACPKDCFPLPRLIN